MTNRPFKPGDDVKAGVLEARILAVTSNGTIQGEIRAPNSFGLGERWFPAAWASCGSNIFVDAGDALVNTKYLHLCAKTETRNSPCGDYSLTKKGDDEFVLGADVALEDMSKQQVNKLMDFLIQCYREGFTS